MPRRARTWAPPASTMWVEMVSDGKELLSTSKTLRCLRPSMIAAAEPATRAPTMIASKSELRVTRTIVRCGAGKKKEPPLSKGLSRCIEARSLGLIQQQDRHLASLRRNHSGGKLVIKLLLLLFRGLFLHSTLQFGFGFD